MHPPEDVREQTRLVMENLKQCLQAAGTTFADVVRTDVFVTNMEDQDAIGEVMEYYLQGHYPASTLVEVKRLVDKECGQKQLVETGRGLGRWGAEGKTFGLTNNSSPLRLRPSATLPILTNHL